MTADDVLPTASRKALEARAAWIRKLREFFWRHDFVEVETPLLSHDSVIDRHLDPFEVPVPELGRSLYLQTSPEFGMKRLLLQGLPAIFQITRAFRRSERGRFHNPEFTMCEWYRVGDDYQRGQAFLEQLVIAMFGRGALRRLSYRDAFLESVGVDPFDEPSQALISFGRSRMDQLADATSTDVDWWRDAVFAEWVQPRLGAPQPTLLYDFPASQSALARVESRDYGQVAQRFELFVDGVELANGYYELLDPEELLQRNRASNVLRCRDGKPALPEQSRLLNAMQRGLPICSGVALGVDRSLQVMLQAESIDDVIAFPIERA